MHLPKVRLVKHTKPFSAQALASIHHMPPHRGPGARDWVKEKEFEGDSLEAILAAHPRIRSVYHLLELREDGVSYGHIFDVLIYDKDKHQTEPAIDAPCVVVQETLQLEEEKRNATRNHQIQARKIKEAQESAE